MNTQERVMTYLNDNCVEPTEHMESVCHLIGIVFIDEQDGWQPTEPKKQVTDEEIRSVVYRVVSDEYDPHCECDICEDVRDKAEKLIKELRDLLTKDK
jgi:hypothetical protein